MVERYRGGRFCQSIAHHHVQSDGVGKLAYLVGHGSARRREEVAVLQSDGFLQQGIDCFFVEFIFHPQHQGRCLAQAHIVQVVFSSHLEGVEHQGASQRAFVGDTFVHALVDFLPEARHAAHHRGTHLAEGLLHLGRAQVDAYQGAPVQAEVSPCLFEDMCQGQEVERHVVVGQGAEQVVVHAENLVVVAVAQHDALGLAGGARGVENVHQVMFVYAGRPFIHQRLVGQPFAQLQKLVPIEGSQVARVFANRAVEDNHLFQRLAVAEHREGGIVLELFADEQVAYAGVVDDVLHLQGRTGGIERDSDGAVGKGGKVCIEAFGLVLREDAYVLLLLYF